MKVDVQPGDIVACADECIVVNLFEGVAKPGGPTGAVDTALGGPIAEAVRLGDFRGKKGDVLWLRPAGKIPAKRVLVVGLGEKRGFGLDGVREASAKAAQAVRDARVRRFTTVVHGAGVGGLDVEDAAEAMAEGTILGAYQFDRFKTQREDIKVLDAVTILERERGKLRRVTAGAERGVVIAESVNLARDMANLPSNEKVPTALAGMALKAARDAKVKCVVLDDAKMRELGMGAVLGVARGSSQPPKFLVLEYEGRVGMKPVALIGKGITFDTGGISLKPQDSPLGPMYEMKHDMTGAAAVVATMCAAARLGLKVNLVGLAPLTENMPGGNAQKPGDVVTAFDGKTIEVLNTDAEGRLVLADALGYASKWEPQAMIDVATLTGAAIVALGRKCTAVFSNDRGLVRRLESAAKATGDRVWELPIWEDYDDLVKSDVADVKNVGGPTAGSIAGAVFLKKFVGNKPWMHLDIAGSCWIHGNETGIKKAYYPKGSSGVPVRILVQMLRDWNRGG